MRTPAMREGSINEVPKAENSAKTNGNHRWAIPVPLNATKGIIIYRTEKSFFSFFGILAAQHTAEVQA